MAPPGSAGWRPLTPSPGRPPRARRAGLPPCPELVVALALHKERRLPSTPGVDARNAMRLTVILAVRLATGWNRAEILPSWLMDASRPRWRTVPTMRAKTGVRRAVAWTIRPSADVRRMIQAQRPANLSEHTSWPRALELDAPGRQPQRPRRAWPTLVDVVGPTGGRSPSPLRGAGGDGGSRLGCWGLRGRPARSPACPPMPQCPQLRRAWRCWAGSSRSSAAGWMPSSRTCLRRSVGRGTTSSGL